MASFKAVALRTAAGGSLCLMDDENKRKFADTIVLTFF